MSCCVAADSACSRLTSPRASLRRFHSNVLSSKSRYLLKLTFPGALVDDERARGVYDASNENGTITLHLPKQNRGLDFPGLDLLTRLRTPAPFGSSSSRAQSSRVAQPGRPLIQVVSSTSTDAEDGEAASAGPGPAGDGNHYHYSGEDCDDAEEDEEEGEDSVDAGDDAEDTEAAEAAAEEAAAVEAANGVFSSFSLSAPPRVPLAVAGDAIAGDAAPAIAGAAAPAIAVVLPGSGVRYGFHSRFSNFFRPLRDGEFAELVRLPGPDTTPAEARSRLQAQEEDAAFDRFRCAQTHSRAPARARTRTHVRFPSPHPTMRMHTHTHTSASPHPIPPCAHVRACMHVSAE